jgi:hypothetical protein
MGQYFTHKYRKYRDALAGRTIDADRACPQCEYNLRGLREGGVCPECGTTIVVDDPFRDSLSDAPVRVITRLRNGMWIALASLIGIVAAPFTAPATFRNSAAGWGVLVFALATIWAAAVWMITRPIDTSLGPRHGFGKPSKLRRAAATSQLAWPVLTLLLIYVVTIGNWSALMTFLFPTLLLTGLIGLSVLSVFLMGLADWTHDEPARKKLNLAAWGIPIATIGLWMGTLAPVMTLLACALSVLWLVSLAAFGLAMISLVSSVTWSVRHAGERARRDRRLREQRRREDEEADAGAFIEGPDGPIADPWDVHGI